MNIQGTRVEFPYKIYPTQMQIVTNLLRAFTESEHAIIESPTGTGKTLALLCSSLAWQKQHNERKRLEAAEKNKNDQMPKSLAELRRLRFEEDDDDFAEPVAKVSAIEKIMEQVSDEEPSVKVFYGSRTHRQIAQAVKEMKATSYRPRMCILGSRQQYCVNPKVMKAENRNEECSALLEQNKCRYYERFSNIRAYQELKPGRSLEVWDIEDLVTVGKKLKGCPYFAFRAMATHAEIVFCPYSYLVDPSYRDAMNIDLTNSIVILDEAHNIEDMCRQAASLDFTDVQLKEVVDNLLVLTDDWCKEHSAKLRYLIESFGEWASDRASRLTASFQEESCVLSQVEAAQVFASCGLSIQVLPDFDKALRAFTNVDNEMSDLSQGNKALLTSLIRVLEHMLKQSDKYRLAIVRNKPGENTWRFRIGFWCLDPSVAFESLAKAARTVVLASGTLSPLPSFASELGCNFPHVVSANHVVKNEQVWVGSCTNAPNGSTLTGTFAECAKYSYQDGVGESLSQVCNIFDKGVLCFISSYSLLDQLMKRWKSTGLYSELDASHKIFIEPRDSRDFEAFIQEYYATIERGEAALLFGVYRGKISEGIDFADNYARAVVTVGIPYPHFKDVKVDLKRSYNDAHVKYGLMSGSEWYSVQGFRAYNQALGRCLRHRNDWGAIIMLDSRIERINTSYLPGWIRKRVLKFTHFSQMEQSLREFAKRQE